MLRACVALLACAVLAWPAVAGAQARSQSLVLVAKPEFRHPLYGQSVLVVRSFGRQQHLGFIVNRPTRLKLGQMFPGHAPSQKVVEPVFIGGPVNVNAIFALVARDDSPGRGSIEVIPGVFAAFNAGTVDRIIESEPLNARFVTGLVVWRPGELAKEIDRGAWYVLEANSDLVRRDPSGLWEDLVNQAAFERTVHARR